MISTGQFPLLNESSFLVLGDCFGYGGMCDMELCGKPNAFRDAKIAPYNMQKRPIALASDPHISTHFPFIDTQIEGICRMTSAFSESVFRTHKYTNFATLIRIA